MTEIMSAAEVADYYKISLSSLKRWVMLSRRGALDFPMPVSPKGNHLRFRKEDILSWGSKIGNMPPEQPAELKIETPAEQKCKNAKVSKDLAKMGVIFNKKGAES